MKYIDVHTHRSHSTVSAQLPSVVRGIFKRKKTKKINYKLRFYMVIGFILLSSFYYLRHQIRAEEPSVFKDLYTIIASRLSEVRLPTLGGKSTEGNSPIERERSKADSRSKPAVASKQPIVYYFPKMDSRNRITFVPRKESFVQRRLPNPKASPLYAGIVFGLLNNPIAEEEAIVDVFPEKTTLKNAWVENKVLLLDFSREFEQGRYGDKGLVIQIQQILWTLFKAPLLSGNFDHISFLIEGKRKAQLGGHGVPIKPFYSRKDLREHIHAR